MSCVSSPLSLRGANTCEPIRRWNKLQTFRQISLLCLLGMTYSVAKADTVTYYATGNPDGHVVNGGGATSVNGTVYTRLVADDITPVSGYAGSPVNTILFSVTNTNAQTVTVSPILEFFTDNNGQPGTLFDSILIAPVTIASGTGDAATITSSSSFFSLPSGTFFAGLVFTDGGDGSATAAQLNNIGQLFTAEGTGSSASTYFVANSAGAPGSDPSGSLTQSDTGVLAYRFEDVVAPAATPEPSSISLMLLGLGAVGGVVRRKFRRS